MKNIPQIIQGGSHTDERGTLRFVNDFDLKEVRRFYYIIHSDVTTIRAWRGHKVEQRWFYVVKGEFKIKLVQIDNWIKPNPNLEQQTIILSAAKNQVLHIPVGYASSLQALEENSELMVFADSDISNAKNDDYLFPVDYFGKWEQ